MIKKLIHLNTYELAGLEKSIDISKKIKIKNVGIKN